jgi:hypothetical protein
MRLAMIVSSCGRGTATFDSEFQNPCLKIQEVFRRTLPPVAIVLRRRHRKNVATLPPAPSVAEFVAM